MAGAAQLLSSMQNRRATQRENALNRFMSAYGGYEQRQHKT